MANIFKAKTLVSRTGIFSHEVIAPNLVYNTGDQTISGIKTFNVAPIVSGNAFITGVNLSSYATVSNLFTTGSTLDNKINSLSGVSVLTFGDQNISGNKIFLNNIGVSGTGVFNAIDLNNVDILSISGVDVSIVNGNVSLTNRPTVNGTGVVLSGELEGMIINSGSLLNNKIDSLSGSAVLTYGNQNVYGIKYFYSGVVITGDGSTNGGHSLVAKNSAGTNGLQFNPAQEGGAGNLYFNAGTTSRLYNVGDSTLEFYINSNQYRVANSFTIGNGSDVPDHTVSVINRYGYFGIGSGFSNPLERLHVSGGNLRVDGKILLSGNLVLTGVDLSSYATKSAINSLSGQVVFTTGNQIISGIKTFVDNTVFGDPSQGDFLVISGNTFTIYGSGNFTNGLFVSGVPVLTGVDLSAYATVANLASTGIFLNNKINNLSGFINDNVVFTTGNQTIAGNKNFTGDINLTGNSNRIGKNHYIETNDDHVFIKDQFNDLILSSEEYILFYDQIGSVSWGGRTLSDSLGQDALNWDNRNLINKNGSPVLTWTGDNIGIGTNTPTEKLQVDGNIIANNLVYNTGNQTILGQKTFSGTTTVINGNLYVSFLTSGLSGIFGRSHSFAGTDVTIVGGERNRVSGNESSIIGGFNNTISGCFSNINGGCLNIVNANFGIINNGRNNTIGRSDGFFTSTTLYTVNNVIEGGASNCISTGPINSAIIGGNNNSISSVAAGLALVCGHTIIGGSCNFAIVGCQSSIIGGFCNSMAGTQNAIIGGCCNYQGSTWSVIAGGACNSGLSVTSNIGPNFIVGDKNRIDTSYSASILGGCDNKICGNCSSIAGGNSNILGFNNRTTNASFIGGGAFNIITGATPDGCGASNVIYSTIVGGFTNKITNCLASILGGRQNIVSHCGATLIGDGGARDKISRGACSLSLDFNGGIFLTGSNITLSPSPLPGRVDFCNSNLINATPNILSVNTNFSIGAGYNSRVVLANSGSMLTGTINLGNPTGFNSSIIQIGVGQVEITGAAGVIIQSYNNQFKTAGSYATISLLHSGNNGYIIYGNTSL